eukprot:Hpha_TRINITY_DN1280_c0_g1::TRINITY_DN1280_c0_g1_i1::g.44847::m.44847
MPSPRVFSGRDVSAEHRSPPAPAPVPRSAGPSPRSASSPPEQLRQRKVSLQELSARLNVPVDHLVGGLHRARTEFTVVANDAPAVGPTPLAQRARSLMYGDTDDGPPVSRYGQRDGRNSAQSLPLSRPWAVPLAQNRAPSSDATPPILGHDASFAASGQTPSAPLSRESPAPVTHSFMSNTSKGAASSERSGPRSPFLGPQATTSWRSQSRPYRVIRMQESPSAASAEGPGAGLLGVEVDGAASQHSRQHSPGDNLLVDSPIGAGRPHDDTPFTLQAGSPMDGPNQTGRKMSILQTLFAPAGNVDARTTDGDAAEVVFFTGTGGGGVLAVPTESEDHKSFGQATSGPAEGEELDALAADAEGGKGKNQRVTFKSFEGSPIESIYVYEALQQDMVVMDVVYARPKLTWCLIGLAVFCSAVVSYQGQHLERASTFNPRISAAILSFWVSLGELVVFGIIFPCAWLPSREEVRMMRSRKGKALVAFFGVVLCLERLISYWSLYLYSDAEKATPHLSTAQYPVVLIVFRAILCLRLIWVEVLAVLIILAGVALVLSSAYSNGGYGSTHQEIEGVWVGIIASVMVAGELIYMQKLRGSGLTLMLLVTGPRLICAALSLPLAIGMGASFVDIFDEASHYERWRLFTMIISACTLTAGAGHAVAFLHPVSVSLLLSGGAAFAVPMVVANQDILDAGYLIGLILILLGACWGGFLSSQLRRNVTVELPLPRWGSSGSAAGQNS